MPQSNKPKVIKSIDDLRKLKNAKRRERQKLAKETSGLAHLDTIAAEKKRKEEQRGKLLARRKNKAVISSNDTLPELKPLRVTGDENIKRPKYGTPWYQSPKENKKMTPIAEANEEAHEDEETQKTNTTPQLATSLKCTDDTTEDDWVKVEIVIE